MALAFPLGPVLHLLDAQGDPPLGDHTGEVDEATASGAQNALGGVRAIDEVDRRADVLGGRTFLDHSEDPVDSPVQLPPFGLAFGEDDGLELRQGPRLDAHGLLVAPARGRCDQARFVGLGQELAGLGGLALVLVGLDDGQQGADRPVDAAALDARSAEQGSRGELDGADDRGGGRVGGSSVKRH